MFAGVFCTGLLNDATGLSACSASWLRTLKPNLEAVLYADVAELRAVSSAVFNDARPSSNAKESLGADAEMKCCCEQPNY